MISAAYKNIILCLTLIGWFEENSTDKFVFDTRKLKCTGTYKKHVCVCVCVFILFLLSQTRFLVRKTVYKMCYLHVVKKKQSDVFSEPKTKFSVCLTQRSYNTLWQIQGVHRGTYLSCQDIDVTPEKRYWTFCFLKIHNRKIQSDL